MAKEKKLTVNQYVNVKDIKDQFLFTKNGFLMCYVRIHKYNIDLLKQEEKRGKKDQLSSSYEGERKEFAYFSYPREIDLDNYKNDIKKRYQEEEDIGIRNMLEIMLEEANQLSTSGENYEHQHFIKLWAYIGRREIREVKMELIQRARAFEKRYRDVGIPADILDSGEIIKLCNLYGNSNQAPFDVPSETDYERMIFINE